MLDKISSYIKERKLLTPGATVIVGVSGGADSVALLHILQQTGYHCIAAHCNFHLRNEESDRDAEFVCKYANELNIPFEQTDFETKDYAGTHKVSIEMAARDLRYEWFESVRVKHHAEAIAVAHHRDDNIETLLMNLVRGTGLRGFTGIPSRNGHVVRPLLPCSREEILAYLLQYDLEYVEDSTNATTEYTRNKFRHEVIPMLETINPGVQKTLSDTIERFIEIEGFYNAAVEIIKERVFRQDHQNIRIDKYALQEVPYFQNVLFELLTPYGFNSNVIADIAASFHKEPGKIFYSKTHQLLSDRQYLFISEININEHHNQYNIGSRDRFIHKPFNMKVSSYDRQENFKVSRKKTLVQLDAELLHFPLTIRCWHEGDSFVPFGMKNKKKLSDFFIDQKVSRFEKENSWLILSGEDIIWIVGQRIDNRFRITESTKKVIEFELIS